MALAKVEPAQHLSGGFGHDPVAITFEQVWKLVILLARIRRAEDLAWEICRFQLFAALYKGFDFDQSLVVPFTHVIPEWSQVASMSDCSTGPNDPFHARKLGGRSRSSATGHHRRVAIATRRRGRAIC